MPNFQVLHIAKCNFSATKGTEIHNERKISDDKKQYQSNTNENIDSNRTHLNVDLINDMKANYYSMAKDRITAIRGGVSPSETLRNEEGHIITPALRKDAVWTCDTIISASPDFFKERFHWDKDNPQKADFEGMNKYFKDSLEFMKDRYGANNTLGAIIHYDETTPHMHVTWVPVVQDEKSKTGEKLCYKELSSGNQLRQLQTDFNELLRSKGYDLERGEVDSKKKHLNQQREKINQQIKENEKKLSEIEHVKTDFEAMKNGSYVIPSMKAKEVQAQNEALRLENRELKERFKNTEVKIDRLEKANDGYEKKIADYYKPTERFAKDQRDKQTVYLDYLANNPQAKEAVKPFESEYAAIRQYGKELLEHKWGYVECGNNLKETEQKIADNAAQKGDERAAITDISKCNKELYDMRGTVDNRRECLDALEGKLFKGKEKKALQSEIEGIQSKIEKVENHLQESYGIKETYPDDLAKETNRHTERLDDLEQKGKDLAVQRSTLHAERYNHLQEYKYMAVKSKAFRQEWQNVIGRWDNDFKPEFQDSIRLNIDQLTRDERTSFKDRLVSDKFDKSPAMSFIKNQEEAKTQSKSISQNHDIGHSL